MTKQEFKEDLKYRMEQDALYRHCDCPICEEAHELFKNTPDVFLEERWQEHLERKNYQPSEEEIARRMEWVKSRGWMK